VEPELQVRNALMINLSIKPRKYFLKIEILDQNLLDLALPDRPVGERAKREEPLLRVAALPDDENVAVDARAVCRAVDYFELAHVLHL
jgi:hypothetical protein